MESIIFLISRSYSFVNKKVLLLKKIMVRKVKVAKAIKFFTFYIRKISLLVIKKIVLCIEIYISISIIFLMIEKIVTINSNISINIYFILNKVLFLIKKIIFLFFNQNQSAIYKSKHQ